MSQIKSCISCIRYTAVIFVNDMDAVIKGEPTLVNEQQVLRVYAIMEAAKKSSDENRVIKLDI